MSGPYHIGPWGYRGLLGVTAGLPAAGTAAATDKIPNVTAAGVAQTWTPAELFTLFLGSTRTFNAPVVILDPDPAVETPFIAGASAVGSGTVFKVENATSSNGNWATTLRLMATSTFGNFIIGQGTTDSGTAYLLEIRSQIGASTASSTRGLCRWWNYTTGVMTLSAAGGLAISGGSTPSLTVGASGTAVTQERHYSSSLTPASVAANTTAEQTFTVTGLTTADKVFVNPPASFGDGLGIVGVRVSAADTIAIRFANNTAGSLTPVSGTYQVVAIRS